MLQMFLFSFFYFISFNDFFCRIFSTNLPVHLKSSFSTLPGLGTLRKKQLFLSLSSILLIITYTYVLTTGESAIFDHNLFVLRSNDRILDASFGLKLIGNFI